MSLAYSIGKAKRETQKIKYVPGPAEYSPEK